jgi:hypothetical protein
MFENMRSENFSSLNAGPQSHDVSQHVFNSEINTTGIVIDSDILEQNQTIPIEPTKQEDTMQEDTMQQETANPIPNLERQILPDEYQIYLDSLIPTLLSNTGKLDNPNIPNESTEPTTQIISKDPNLPEAGVNKQVIVPEGEYLSGDTGKERSNETKPLNLTLKELALKAGSIVDRAKQIDPKYAKDLEKRFSGITNFMQLSLGEQLMLVAYALDELSSKGYENPFWRATDIRLPDLPDGRINSTGGLPLIPYLAAGMLRFMAKPLLPQKVYEKLVEPR